MGSMDVSRLSLGNTRRALRTQREQGRQRRLIVRQRWFFGGLASALTVVMAFTGMNPAIAGEAAPEPEQVVSAQAYDSGAGSVTLGAEPTPSPSVEAPDVSERHAEPEQSAAPENPSESESDGEVPSELGHDQQAVGGSDESSTPPTAAEVESDDIDASADESAALEGNDMMMPMAIGSVPPGGAVINVNLRALRTGANQTAPTQGIQLRLHTRATGGSGNDAYETYGTAVNQEWATCTADTDGDCSFYIPSSGVGSSVRYWVVPVANTGTGSFLSDYLVTGNNTNSGSSRFAVTPYAFRTPVISASSTPYQLPGSGTGNMTSNSRVGNPNLPLNLTTATSNRWAHYPDHMIATLNNPRYQTECTPGLKVALVVDLSTSMTYNNNEGLKGARAAASAFATEFADKGVSLGIYSFGSNANNTVRNPALVTGGNLNSVLTTINNMSVSGTQYTNWDRGINQIQGQNFDIAVILTDGNPTRYANPSQPSSGSWTDLRRIEEAILSANLVKNQGTQILTFGVGDNLSSAMPQNLRAVTGPVQWTASGGIPIGNADFAIPSNWNVVSTELAALAASLTCEVNVQVHKLERAADGTTSDGEGWTFTPTRTGSGTMTPAGAQTTTDSGLLPQPWTIAFTSAAHTTNLRIVEQPRDGWAFESVTCLNNGAVMPNVANSADFTLSGLKVNDNVVCTVINRQSDASVQVDKYWVINGGDPTPDGKQPAGLEAQLTLTGPGSDTATDQKWGVPRGDYAAGDEVTIDESVTIDAQLLPGCRLVSDLVTSIDPSAALPFDATLVAGDNAYEVTNVVECTQTLTLVKDAQQPSIAATGAEDDDWTLSATADQTTPVTGNGTATGAVLADTAYTLTETLAANAHADADLFVPAGQAWECVAADDGAPLPNESWTAAGSVTVSLGRSVECTVTNVTAELTLLKYVVPGGSAASDKWNLVATAAGGARPAITGSWTGADAEASGADQAVATNTIAVKPGEPYALSEVFTDANLAYLFDRVDVWNGTEWEEVTDFSAVTVTAGEHAVYRFVNKPAPAFALPLTGGMSTDAFLIAGGLILAATLGFALWYFRRQRSAV